MIFEFYLDAVCSFMLFLIENACCCCENYDSTNQKLKCKRRILLIRVTLGLMFNIAAFITVCVVSKEIFIQKETALGIFWSIVVFTLISYITIGISVWLNDKNDDDELLIKMISYRIYEIEFDILVLFYSLVLSNWEMTDFSTATTLLACIDTLTNTILLGKNSYDLKGGHKQDLPAYLICGVIIPPLVPVVLFFTEIGLKIRGRKKNVYSKSPDLINLDIHIFTR